ncbi:MAG: hypothetical protein SGCHY_003807 [Lobulomycetales sp.]
MIIPEAELDQFCAAVSDGGKVKVQLPDVGEFLVAYFEDASFSIVSEDDVIPFDPREPPYTSYVQGPDAARFCTDKGVLLATTYWQKHALPPSFTWLKEETIRAVEAGGGENLTHPASAAATTNGTASSTQQSANQASAFPGTGIFGYEKRRTSHPPVKHDPSIGNTRAAKTATASQGPIPSSLPPAKKQKTEGRKGPKKKSKNAAAANDMHGMPASGPGDNSNSSLNTLPSTTSRYQHHLLPQTIYPGTRDASSPIHIDYTKTPGCDRCYPSASIFAFTEHPTPAPAAASISTEALVSRTLCADCSRILDTAAAAASPVPALFHTHKDAMTETIRGLTATSKSATASVNSNIVRLMQRIDSFNLGLLRGSAAAASSREDAFFGYF